MNQRTEAQGATSFSLSEVAWACWVTGGMWSLRWVAVVAPFWLLVPCLWDAVSRWLLAVGCCLLLVGAPYLWLLGLTELLLAPGAPVQGTHSEGCYPYLEGLKKNVSMLCVSFYH